MQVSDRYVKHHIKQCNIVICKQRLTWYLKSALSISARSLATLGMHGYSDATIRA